MPKMGSFQWFLEKTHRDSPDSIAPFCAYNENAGF
jgi:hypothetical protein